MTTNNTYEAEILQWRAEKYNALVGENGWVSVAGLYSLNEGRNLIGSNVMCEVVLPERAPTFLGVADLKGKTVRFQVAEGVQAKINGRLAQKAILRSSRDAKPSFITWDDLRMVVHEHGGKYAKYGIRIWDNKRAERFNLPPLKWFPINKDFQFNATYTRYPEPKKLEQDNSAGDTVEDHLDGFVSFRHEGKTYKLDVSETKTKKLFIKFRDGTSSKESYPPSRYYYTEPPKEGKVVLDFNYSYSPPCAFTAFATCIFAPPQNTLPFRVEAGEIYRG